MKLKLVAAFAASCFLLACGKEEKKKTETAGGGTTTAAFSNGWKNNSCATCHGDKGLGITGLGSKIPGAHSGTEAAYISFVRQGSAAKGMTPYNATSYSDADAKNDYALMSAANK